VRAPAVVADVDVVAGVDELAVVVWVLEPALDVVADGLVVLVTTTVVVPPPHPAANTAAAASSDALIPGLTDPD
jgi:hypothetical protein